MRSPILSAALAAICFALPATAQKKFQGMAFSGAHNQTTLAVFADDFSAGYMATVSHGQPEWQATHDAMIEKLKGTTQRLGKDAWTTLTTTAELELGGTKIPAGAYVVAIACGKDGSFSLVLQDAGKAMKSAQLPFGPQTWQPELTVPMTMNKDVAKDVMQKMTMTFAAEPKVVGKGTFTIAWGKHTLTAPAMLHMPAK